MKATDCVFPITYSYNTNEGKQTDVFYGIDLRTYLAGQAMQGILSANPGIMHGNIALPIPSNVAGYAVSCADALIEELNKEKK